MMKAVLDGADGVTLDLTIDETRILSNALNEICNGIDIEEFELRIGADRQTVDALLAQFVRLIDSAR
jgi:hypothetical protein